MMGYTRKQSPQRPRKKVVAELPRELGVFDPADWVAPDRAPKPVDVFYSPAWEAWEAGQRAAYARFQQARADWYATYELSPLDEVLNQPDEFFCGSFVEHDCTGEDCPERPASRFMGRAVE